MSEAIKKIALIFDFDETLVEESTTAFVKSLGVDPDQFWKETNSELMYDWDPVPAYLYKLIELSGQSVKTAITQKKLAAFGKKVVYKAGVPEFFEKLKQEVLQTYPDTEVEYYIVSSGIEEIIRNTAIAGHFADIWACSYAYRDDGCILFPRKVVSFTDKTRYIFQISKGMVGKEYRNKPYCANDKIPEGNFAIPIRNMIYIGDGMTDIPCFSLIRRFGGQTIGVYDAQVSTAFGKAWKFVEEKRVTGVYHADYTACSDLYKAIIEAITQINTANWKS